MRLTSPAMIDYHNMLPRSQGGDPDDLGNQAPLCHECHMKHHGQGGMRLAFEGEYVTRSDGASGVLRRE